MGWFVYKIYPIIYHSATTESTRDTLYLFEPSYVAIDNTRFRIKYIIYFGYIRIAPAKRNIRKTLH